MNALESAIAELRQDVTALSRALDRNIRELKAETSNAVNDLASSFANELNARCPVPMAPPPANGESWPVEDFDKPVVAADCVNRLNLHQ